jgi:hypothetical protein
MKSVLIIGLATMLSTAALADTTNKTDASTQHADSKAASKISEKSKAILDEAREAMKETTNALSFLNDNKTKEAQNALQSATGKLEMVVARKPELGLAAFDINVTTNALLNDANTVTQMKEQAIKALQENRVQEARQIVANLRSDTVISVANIPLATYPAALKEAARLIDQKKIDEAKAAITSALGTVVMTETVIPLPLARADYFIDDAAKLSQKNNRSSEEKAQLQDDINNGRDALKMAEALGYVPKDAFKDSYAKLDEAQKNANAGKSGNWFKDVQSKISSYFALNDKGQAQAQEE